MQRSSLCLFAALFLFVRTPVSAQTTVSLMGGLNRTSLDLDAPGAGTGFFEPLNRRSVGLNASLPVSDRFAVRLGGSYSQKGGSLDVMGILSSVAGVGVVPENPTSELDDLDFDAALEMDYLELTALAELRFPLSGERVWGHLLAGPALARRSSCRMAVSVREGGTSLRETEDCDIIDLDAKHFDFGIAGGAGIEIGLTGRVNAQLGVLYILGLLDNSEDASDTLKHRTLTIRAGLGVPVG